MCDWGHVCDTSHIVRPSSEPTQVGFPRFGGHRSGIRVGPALTHPQRLHLMAAVDDLLLPWQVDLVVASA